MVDAGGSIEALLKLDATNFDAGINKAITDLEKFRKSILSFESDSAKITKALSKLPLIFDQISSAMGHLDSVSKLSQFRKLSVAVYELSKGLKTLSSETLDVEQGINTMNNIFKAWGQTLNGTEIKVKGLVVAEKELASVKKTSLESQLRSADALNRNRDAVAKLVSGEHQLANAEQQVVGSSLQESSSIEKDSMSKEKATASTNKLTNANKNLKNSFSMLKNAVTLVGSMIAYNFIHNLAMVTTETINAKSEMNGYFQMLGYSTSQVDHFNKALDETVKKFPRLNKYALGETISSIGVEFELTTKEMEKAMPVVSMITSEYLRAGRNVNEASLAVKDILQGEFQRLSRETGVKGQQLKDAGWSGDKKDVMGLLEALDKVGKERNWDKFVAKANSLNDAVLILQNRFSEWTADMVNVVQPSIVNAFNMMMDVGTTFSSMFTGVWKSMNSNSITGTAIKVGVLTTALIHGLKYITMYRSGANLLQASTMGLRKAITSLVFGVNLETSATMRNYEAILLKILGIKAEDMAEGNLVKTINNSILRKGIETTQENINTVSKELNAGATATQTANNIGFVAGLQAVITGKVLDTEATLTLSGAMGVLTATMLASPFTWFVAGLMAIAGAFYVLTGGLDEHWDKMKLFNDTLENSDEIIQQHDDYLKQLAKTVGEDSQKYRDAKKSVEDFNDKLGSSKALVEAYKTEVASIPINLETSVKANLRLEGFSEKDIDDLSKRLSSLNEGYDTYYRSLQVIHKQEDDFQKYNRTMVDSMQERGRGVDEINEKTDQMTEHWNNFIKHSAEHNTSDDWWSGSWAGFLAWLDSIQIWLDFKTEDLAVWWDDFNKEWSNILPTFADAWESLQLPDIGKMFTDWLSDTQSSFSDTSNSISEMWDNNIAKPIMEFDWLGSANDLLMSAFSTLTSIDVIKMLLDALLPEGASASDGSSDHPSFMEDLSAIFGFDVQSWIDSFNADPLGTLGISLPNIDIIGLIQSLIPTDGLNLGEWLGNLFNLDGVVSFFTSQLSTIVGSASSTASSVSSTFSGLKSTIQGHLNNIVTNVSTGFENAKNYANTKMTGMRDSVTSVINQMTGAWKSMKDSILESARLIYDGVKAKFDSVKNTLSDFFTKLQNPSQWGAGQKSMSRTPRPATARKLFSGVKHGAGINPYTAPSKKVKLSDLVDAVGGNKEVSVSDFLSMFSEGGFGAWSFHKPSKDRVFSVGKEWKSGSPVIKGIGTVGDGYKVKKFWNDKPSFTFEEFQTVAEAIFSAIPYKFYYDSEWKGNWVSALLSGAVNCSDGADALIALASVFGLSGDKIHTTLKDGTGHFYAKIGGRKMDTTSFQNRGSWSPLGGAGSPRGSVANSTTHNITVNITGDVYGVDDLESKIENGVRKGLREQFNDPLSGVM